MRRAGVAVSRIRERFHHAKAEGEPRPGSLSKARRVDAIPAIARLSHPSTSHSRGSHPFWRNAHKRGSSSVAQTHRPPLLLTRGASRSVPRPPRESLHLCACVICCSSTRVRKQETALTTRRPRQPPGAHMPPPLAIHHQNRARTFNKCRTPRPISQRRFLSRGHNRRQADIARRA